MTSPAHPPIAERHPSPVHWRTLVLDPALAGAVPGRARPLRIEFFTTGRPDDGWELPVADVLPIPLAWHPHRPLVAGLAVGDDHHAHPWIADLAARTVRPYPQTRAATGLTEPGVPPLAWCEDGRLALLTPAPRRNPAEQAAWRPAVFEATGPAFVGFEPGQDELVRTAGTRLVLLAPQDGAAETVGPTLLVRSLAASPDGVVLGHVHPAGTGPDEHGLCWATSRLDPADPGRLVPVAPSPVPGPPAQAQRPPAQAPRPSALGDPSTVHAIPTGFGDARLTLLPHAGSGPLLLWIRALRRGEPPSDGIPQFLAAAAHPSALLDLPLHWPDDARPALLNSQITTTVSTAVGLLTTDGAGTSVAVGGHSFGATLALHALARLPELAGAVAHSGCYNRTSTPTGFHYERRSLWTAPEVYQTFSALHFADRLDRPVLLVHGTDDINPATTPEQAVELYRAVVATGGTARLVLLPQEGHTFQSREALAAVAEEHRAWLEKLETS
ncbi:alpha/beta hydrolase family protein [Streptomyces sp. NPDC048257]|uniref:alpha/beta hydrolase family protein n=1 Tax=Streptomyces sp. NPDC048257 TaxID=3365526 RepID=UPI0037185CD1